MDEIYITLYDYKNEDGSITRRMFDVSEPSLEYMLSDVLEGIIEVFTN